MGHQPGHAPWRGGAEQTSETRITGHGVAATKDAPQFIVKSGKSGKEAAHKPEKSRERS